VRYDATSVVCLADAAETCRAFDVIGVDEGQFVRAPLRASSLRDSRCFQFTDVVPFCEAMANAGKQVIVSALDGTFQRKPFGTILELIPLAEDVAKLTAVCAVCYHSAAFSKRITRESEVEVIGGADKYFAVCRGCYLADRRPRLDHDLERALE
jgi:thymidine kinase